MMWWLLCRHFLLAGFYSLDLSHEMDRLCLQRLLLFSEATKIQRQGRSIFPWPVGDLSQKGNWSCFRNEYVDGKPDTITPIMFTPMPTKVGSNAAALEQKYSASRRI